LGGPGGLFGSLGSRSGVVCGSDTVSRLLFGRPLPLSFSSKERQQSAQISKSLSSISFRTHSLAWPHQSQRIMTLPHAYSRSFPVTGIDAEACPNRFFLLVVIFLFLVVVPTLFILFVLFIVPVISRQDLESLHFGAVER
jgi:hypothetical protein